MCHLLEGAGTASDPSLFSLGWAHSRCSMIVFWMEVQMMTNSQYGTQDVDFFIGHTASVRILLTDCKGNVTNCQRHSNTLLKHMCQGSQKLVIVCMRNHNQHSQRNSPGFFTGLQQCIYMCFLLSWVDKVLRSWGRIITLAWWYSSPCASLLVLQGFFLPTGLTHSLWKLQQRL